VRGAFCYGLRSIERNYIVVLETIMSDDFESFEDELDEDVSYMWTAKASVRAMCDIIEKHNLAEEVEELYQIYVAEEKAIWDEWAKNFDEKRK
jgi:hypothetical protein